MKKVLDTDGIKTLHGKNEKKNYQKIKLYFNVKAEKAILAVELEKIILNSSKSTYSLHMKCENLRPERCSVQ